MLLWLGIFVLILATVVGSFEHRLSRAQRRSIRIERKLDRIINHLGLDTGDVELEHVIELARQGKKIEAIKAYREITGADLKQAKDEVERMTGSPA